MADVYHKGGMGSRRLLALLFLAAVAITLALALVGCSSSSKDKERVDSSSAPSFHASVASQLIAILASTNTRWYSTAFTLPDQRKQATLFSIHFLATLPR